MEARWMMEMKKTIAALAITCSLALGSQSVLAEAAGSYTYYQVKKGDTLSKIAKQYHTTVASLKSLNSLKTDTIRIGAKLKVPAAAKRPALASAGKKVISLTAADRKLLAQLVQAETGSSEPFAGKVEVALVVLNRTTHPEFPKTVRGVIYQKTKSGHEC